MYIIFVLIIILFALLIYERHSLATSISKIPIRILVNGTRGKSTVVKNISSLLRSNNIKTFSKITGVTPAYYIDDKNPFLLKRRGGARVTEQFKMIRKAAKNHSEAIVLECMSLNPELQKIESKILQPQYYVITNIREDHLEEMGETSVEWINAICSAIPDNSTVITTETKYLKEIQEYVEKKNCKIVHSIENINSFDSINYKLENYSIAEMIANDLRLKYNKLTNEDLNSDKENLFIKYKINGKNIIFVNGFAINDVPSAQILVDELKHKSLLNSALIIIFNSRSDRPIRSIKFAEWMSSIENVSKYIITGDNSRLAIRTMHKKGVNKNSIVRWNKKQSLTAKESLNEIIKNDSCIIGLGNIKESGFAIINSLSKS